MLGNGGCTILYDPAPLRPSRQADVFDSALPMPTDETRPMDGGDGNPSKKSFCEDARGETKPTLEMKSGGRYSAPSSFL